ncbi:hypothetical protein NKR19_g7245 [Coniochaeta hoffmannii]|uniref:HIT-type domain-containing protein n=1 Tax=Coniochaeta hoffmannii TaxID=91930 RepID=A0AA38RIC9_9PEZI|nr:hypothetical protein NKR19_g7245 [Coniochaeta hoffmannii]
MDPPEGSDTRGSDSPSNGPATAQAADAETSAPPISQVSKLSINNAPPTSQKPNSDDRTSAEFSITAPVTVFKQVPEPPQEGAATARQPGKSQRICGVCDKEPGKYKCPRCGMYYCSVPCSKAHKANHPPDPPPPPQATPAPQISRTKRPHEPEDPYSVLLDHRSDLERLFAKYPNLESDLIQIERATLPPLDSFPPAAGGLPTRYQPPQQHQRQQEPWTRQVGLKKGAAALKKARMDPSEDGDAVREYCELVLHLLSTSRQRRDSEALDVVRRETVDEERGVIKRLIKMEEE